MRDPAISALITAGLIMAASILSAAIAIWIRGRMAKTDYVLQARRENTILRHMELLLEDSQREISGLRKENAELRLQVSDMQAEVAEMKAGIILLLNAVEKLNTSEISQRAVEAVSKSVAEVLNSAKKKTVTKPIQKDERA